MKKKKVKFKQKYEVPEPLRDSGLVEPSDDIPEIEVEYIQENLQKAGVIEEDSVWLSEVILSLSFTKKEDPNDWFSSYSERFEQLIRKLSASYKEVNFHRDAGIICILQKLIMNHGSYPPEDTKVKIFKDKEEEKLLPWVYEWFKFDRNINWKDGIKVLIKKDNYPEFYEFLLKFNLLDPAKLIDYKILHLYGYETFNHLYLTDNSESILFWLRKSLPKTKVHFEDNFSEYYQPLKNMLASILNVLKERLQNTPEEVGRYFVGIFDSIEIAAAHSQHDNNFGIPDLNRTEEHYWNEIIDVLCEYFDFLNKQVQNSKTINKIEKPFEGGIDLLWAWFKFGAEIVRINASKIDTETKKQLLLYAKKEVSLIRNLTRKTEKEESRKKFTSRTKFYSDALLYIHYYGSTWDLLKPLLLSFRDLNQPSVQNNLQYWYEHNVDNKNIIPWNWIPERISAIFHNYVRFEIKEDPKLEKLRGEFANFCLERLKTKKSFNKKFKDADIKPTNDDFVEKDPSWRKCYIRAIRELKTNPNGKAHHIMHWVYQNDPDPEVREFAKIAYKELRHDVAYPDGVSPKRALLAAFWWLRQAHLLSLGIKVDARGANRTRQKEIRRTKEKDESNQK